MFYEKRIISLFCFGMSIFLCACNAKEAVMLNAESGEVVCTSVEDEDLTLFEDNTQGENTDQSRIQNFDQEQYIYVYITGEVLHPGVYQLVEDARIYELLMEAGGYTPEADEFACNLAGKVSDGMQIHIPNKVDSEEKREIIIGDTDTTGEVNVKVNLNEASISRLMDIPGIGTVKAEAIITYREKHGAFQSIEDIMQVEGIKNGTYEKIKDYIDIKN